MLKVKDSGTLKTLGEFYKCSSDGTTKEYVEDLYITSPNIFDVPTTATYITSSPTTEWTTFDTNTWYCAFAYNGYGQSSCITSFATTATGITFTTTNTSYAPTRFMRLKPSTTFTINVESPTNSQLAMMKYSKNANNKYVFEKYLFTPVSFPKTFTTDDTEDCFYGLLFYATSANVSKVITNIQLVEGDFNNHYIYPTTDAFMNCGPNSVISLELNKWYKSFAYNGNGNSTTINNFAMTDSSMTINTSNAPYGPAQFFKLLPSTTYSVKYTVSTGNGSVAIMKYEQVSGGYKWKSYLKTPSTSPVSFTTDADENALYGIVFYGTANTNITYTNIQLIPFSYHPYGKMKIFDAGWPTTVSGPTSFSLPDARAHSTDWEIEGNVSQSGTPSAASPIEVEGVGNKYVYPNQEFNIARKSTATSIWGCTMTPNLTDGSIHLTGTGTTTDFANDSGLSEWYPHRSMIAGHVYYLDMKGINNTGIPISYRSDGSSRVPWTGPAIFTRGSAGGGVFSWNVINGQTYDTTFIPQIIDLTKSYGAGNEPLTIQEFKERLYADSLKLTAKDTYGQRFPTATSGSNTLFGVTFSALGNGKYRVTGTGTATDWGRSSGFAQWATADMCVAGHKYFAYAKGAPSGMLRLRDFNSGTIYITSPTIITCNTYARDYSICTWITNGKVYDYTVEVFLIDLTELYGEGNEPSTVDEFLQRKGINDSIPVLPYRADASYKYAIPVETADRITHMRLDAPLYKIGTGTDSLTADGTCTTSIGHTVLSAGTSTISDAATNAPYYCSQQTNGTLSGTSITLDTGVTDADVYYVKATPATSTVEVIDISTIKGNNTVDITTDVAPSNATITYRKRTK